MPLTPQARRVADRLGEEALGARKAWCRERIEAFQRLADPPLSNAEVAVALGLVEVGARGISPVSRWLSDSPRNRRSRPSTEDLAILEGVLAARLLLAVRADVEPGASREPLVLDEADRAHLGRGWRVLGVPQPDALDDPAFWDAFDGRAPAVAAPAVATPGLASPVRASPARVEGVTEREEPVSASVPATLPRRTCWFGEGVPVGLGAMRLSNPGRPEPELARAVLREAVEAGVGWIDTADAYALDEADAGHNERLVAEVLRDLGVRVPVATKVGFRRPEGRWIPDGRPRWLRQAVERSLGNLGVEALELVQLHVVDPRVPLEEQVGALARLREEGKVLRVGLCNTDVGGLGLARRVTHIDGVQDDLSRWTPADLRDGMVRACAEAGVAFVAHSPLGGHRRALRRWKEAALVEVARRHGCSPAQAALAWVLAAGPTVGVVPGASRPGRVAEHLGALAVQLTPEDLAALDVEPACAEARAQLWGLPTESTGASGAPGVPGQEVVLVLGSPAGGKTSRVLPRLREGLVRLNRDERGGKLADLLPALEEALLAGKGVVSDNTWPTRRSRQPVIAAAHRRGVPVRAEWLDVPLEEALYNACVRLIERRGRLLDPDELAAAGKEDPNLFPPSALYRFQALFEPPTPDEGIDRVDRIPFVRRPLVGGGGRALLLDLDGTLRRSLGPAPFPRSADEVELLPGRRERLEPFVQGGWKLLGVTNQSGVASGQVPLHAMRAAVDRTVELLGLPCEVLACPHPAGPARCWCRKPLPGMAVQHVLAHGLDRELCWVVGDSKDDEGLARNAGMRFVHADAFFSGDGPVP